MEILQLTCGLIFNISTAYNCIGLIKQPSFEWVKNGALKNKKRMSFFYSESRLELVTLRLGFKFSELCQS